MTSTPQSASLASLTSTSADSGPVRPRLDSVDTLRGLVMAIMALDHTRDFFSKDLAFDPSDLDKTYPALVLTLWITTFGILMIASHNLFDYVKPESWGSLGWLWKILHSGGINVPAEGYRFAAGYPLIPWIGVMAAGCGFGSLLLRESVERRKWLFGLGALFAGLFVLLRALN